ncbi:MAG: preprotein translocase subunit SecY [Anaerolineae bacterium]|nr:preprotein translocase subunit SecY [Anaerolineae bacterium]
MLQALRNAIKLPDLRRRIIFTIIVLIVYRLASQIAIPGINHNVLRDLFARSQLLGLLDLFSGGAMSNFSIMAMGVYPYITSSIIMTLLQPIIPPLERLAKEGEAGRQKINMYTYIGTIPLALLQGWAQATLLQREGVLSGFGFSGEALLPTLATLVALTAGTMLAVWLGQLITEQGIGNGISIIIFGGIVSRIPQRVGEMIAQQAYGALIAFVLITTITVSVIVVVQEGVRRIPVQYGRRVLAQRGNRLRVAGGQSTYVPLRVNSAGMIPLIFAQSLMIFPGTVASYFVGSANATVSKIATGVQSFFSPQGNWYWIFYFILVVGFTYFYTDVVFRQQNLPEMLQKNHGFIPGIRPGRPTADYLSGVLGRITLVGALFLAVVAILPWLTRDLTETTTMLITSAGLLIVVGVVLDTMKQLEAQLLMRHYEGFIK